MSTSLKTRHCVPLFFPDSTTIFFDIEYALLETNMPPKLSRAEIADLIKRGKPVPVEYIDLIFPNLSPRLLLSAKDTPEPKSDLLLSLQEQHLYTGLDAQWNNQLIWGESTLALSTLLNHSLINIQRAGGIKLIYLDPPFNVGSDFYITHKVGAKKQKLKMKAYTDSWDEGLNEYLEMIYPIIKLSHEALASTGTLFVHCGHQTSAHLRLILDDVFGAEHFLNEIIFAYGAGGNPSSYFPRKHDSILWYSKSNTHTFTTEAPVLRVPYDSSTLKTHFKHRDNQGRLYRDQKIGTKTYRSYADRGKRVTDVWGDLSAQTARSPISEESTGYPTQKPERLLERIIVAATLPGDLVADFFCGSGTTLSVANRLNRKWLGCDSGFWAVQTAKKRMQKEGASFELRRLLDENRGPLDSPYPNLLKLEQTTAEHIGTVEAPRLVCSDQPVPLTQTYKIQSSIEDVKLTLPLFAPKIGLQKTNLGVIVELQDLGMTSDIVESNSHLVKEQMLHQKVKNRHASSSLIQLTEHWSDWIDLWSISKGNSEIVTPVWSSFKLGRSHQITLVSKPLELLQNDLISIQLNTILGHEIRLELRVPNLKLDEFKSMMWCDPDRTDPIPR